MESLFENIRKAFGALWGFRKRGDSYEIITPFATSTDMYVSVFLTRRNSGYVVTDGGWIDKGVYHTQIPDNVGFEKIFSFFIEDFRIQRVLSPDGFAYFYKTTDDVRFIPNIVFDVANFISMIVNNSLVEFRDELRRNPFRRKARSFLCQNVSSDRLKLNAPISAESHKLRFGAVVASLSGHVSVVNFITGSNYENIRGSFAKSNFTYDLLEQTAANRLVKNKIVLIDDTHFDGRDLEPFIKVSCSKHQSPLMWSSEKGRLLECLNA